MINRDMYKVLKAIPAYPDWIFTGDIPSKVHFLKNDRIGVLLRRALNEDDFVRYASKALSNNPRISLTEEGVCAVEEYRDKYSAAKRSTIALVISGLSLLASIVAIVVSCVK